MNDDELTEIPSTIEKITQTNSPLDRPRHFSGNLISLPASQSVATLPAMLTGNINAPMPDRSNHLQDSSASTDQAPVDSIVARAAAVLDEEMSKGVLAAHSNRSLSPANRQADPTLPLVQQMVEVVNSLNRLLPSNAAATDTNSMQTTSHRSDHIVLLSTARSIHPGGTGTISMTLRNGENTSVQLAPVATDLIGTRGGRIPSANINCLPEHIRLESQDSKELKITIHVPPDTPTGRYTGLLVVQGLDYLRAAIEVHVRGDTTHILPEHTDLPTTTAGYAPGSPVDIPATVKTEPLSNLLPAPPHSTGTDPPAGSPPVNSPPVNSQALNSVAEEAAQLAADGELGNSDAIRLIQRPHRSAEIAEVLRSYDNELTPMARSRLTLEAFTPLPASVDNQRFEPFFDKFPISGDTYRTAKRHVTLKEIQYYNGEMVQLFGECSNLDEVRLDLQGSGYKPLRLQHQNGCEYAIGQFWAHQLTDTSLGPYNASFSIVVAVPEDTPERDSVIRSENHDFATVLPMLHGRYDAASNRYVNHASLFFVQLLDSTQIAIDVGRERMGTDKRPGNVYIYRKKKHRRFSVVNGQRNGVAQIEFTTDFSDESAQAALAQCAADAGVSLPSKPKGAEHIYPCVARIKSNPVSLWQWRSDITPHLKKINTSNARFNAHSPEGKLLIRWGFSARVCGYLPNVRGVVTGI